MIALCTLFNVDYLDKGLVLYESLERVSNEFTLYVLAMDERSYDVLISINAKHLVPIRFSDFENEDLKTAKENRSMGEFCWTCSSSLIEYIFEIYHPDNCTYIDADMYFYDDPKRIIDEMYEKNASAIVTNHRFNEHEKRKEATVGKYCVEFNTFRNDKRGRNLLRVWIDQCLNCCKCLGDGIHWGDQKYIDHWTTDYDYVIETCKIGAGVAPWNINQYKLKEIQGEMCLLTRGADTQNLIFYHFEGLRYIDKNTIDTRVYNTWGVEDRFVSFLYINYLKRIDEKKDFLSRTFNIDILVKSHPAVQLEKKKKIDRIREILKNIFNFSYLLNVSIPSRLNCKKNIVKI